MSSRKTKLLLTRRALRDIAAIETYSIENWGKQTAAKYVANLEAALIRIQERPDLLRPEPEFHARLSFYRAGKHLLVCDRQAETIFLLTVIHASRDIPSRLAELEPTLAAETELLHKQLSSARKRRARRR